MLRHISFPTSTALLMVAALLSVGNLTGCGSSATTMVYPATEQESDVQRTTRSGYDFLRSEKESSAVTISLRAATKTSLRIYTSVHNMASSESVEIDPTAVTVEATMADGETRSFTAYATDEVPPIVGNRTKSNVADLANMSNAIGSVAGASGAFLYGTVKDTENQRGAYSSGSQEPEVSLQDLLLQPQTLPGNQAVDGMVITPFASNAKSVRIEVPVGGVTHVFAYRLERDEA